MGEPKRFFVYVVTCLVNGKRYVGKATVGGNRWYEHQRDAKRGKRRPLAQAIRALGADAFTFAEHATYDTEAEAFEGERALIASLQCKVPNGYNLTDGGEGANGAKRSAETRAKHSANMRKRWEDPAARAATIAFHTGRKRSPETCAKIGAKLKGRTPTDEARANMSAAKRGRKHTDETKAKIAAGNRGKKIDREVVERIAAQLRGRRGTPEESARKSAALRGKPHSAEHVAKVAAANRGRRHSAEARARMSAGVQASLELRRAARARGIDDDADPQLRLFAGADQEGRPGE